MGKKTRQQKKITTPDTESASAVSAVPSVKTRRFSWKLISISIGAAVIVLALGGFVAVKYWQSAGNKQQLSANEVKNLVTAVQKIIELPQGETPNVATVVDVAKLRGQPFFKNAENGDKVLIYATASKAYLFRPSQNKIIEVGPITSSQLPQVAGSQTIQGSALPTPATTPTIVSVAIYNGTNIPRLAAGIRKRLIDNIPGIEVVTTGNAGQYYQETMVIDLHNNPTIAATIAENINGVVTDLPDGEASPAADILVIVGYNDKE